MRLAIICIFTLMLFGCQATSSGIGAGTTSSTPQKGSIEVLDLDFSESIELAEEAARQAYEDVSVSADRTTILIDNRSFWAGDAQALVDPILVQDNDTQKSGIIYEVVARGVGSNMSMVPGYVSTGFFTALNLLVEEREIRSLTFANYEKLDDKGIAEHVAASIPIDQIQFRKYVDSMSDADPFVGVWQLAGGEYTLGLIPDDRDPIYKYKMFVLESQYKNWKPGEIKLKYSRLDQDGIAVSRYLARNKMEFGITFESKRDVLVSINALLGEQLILVKIYPSDSTAHGPGSGSSWHLGGGYFVTNAHVIDGATVINLLIDGTAISAKAVAVDNRLDVAVLKIADEITLPGIPMRGTARIGEQVIVVGFPLGDDLGSSPKITDGLLSGTTGLEGDLTRYLVSAPIQPGNSGGPVFGADGHVIGVAVSKIASNLTDSVGFAVKIQYVQPLLDELGVPLVEAIEDELSPQQICELYCRSVVRVVTN